MEKYGEIVKRLGKGVTGKVYLYKNEETGLEVAVKRMKKQRNLNINSYHLNDIGTLKYLDHSNIVKVIDTVITHKYIYLVLELASFSLQDLIHKHRYQLNLNEVPRLIYSLFDAMAYYFNKNILHLDIKPANILVFNENLWELTDFGLAKQGYCNITPNTLSTNVVTLMYRPINILLGDNNYDSMADIWAMGCVLYEIYTKTILFDGYDELYMIEKIITVLGVPTKDQWPQVVKLGKWSFVKRFEERIPTGITHPEITSRPLLLDLLNTIFDYSNFGKERNSDHITKILTHPYFNEINGGRINYTRLTCLESLYDYNSRIGYYTHKEKLDRTYYYSRIINEPVYNLNILFLAFSIYDRYKTNELEKNKIKITKITRFVTVLLNLAQKTLFIDNIDEEEEYPYEGYDNYVSIEDNIVDVLDWKIYVPTSYDFMIMEITNYTILQRSIATTILFILHIYADINNLEMSTLSKIAIEGMKLYVGYTDITIPSDTFRIFDNITVKDIDKEKIKLLTWDIDENRKEIKLDFDYDRFFVLTKSYSNTVHIY